MTTMCQPWNYLIINPNLFVLEHSWFLKIILDTKMPGKTSYLYHIQLQGSVYVLHISFTFQYNVFRESTYNTE